MNESDKNTSLKNAKRDQGSVKSFQDYRANGLYYIHRQRTMILIPVIFGFFTLVVQGFNIFFVNGMGGFNRPPPSPDGPIMPNQPQPPPTIDLATPAIIFLIFAIFLLIKVIFLIRLRKITHAFERRVKKSPQPKPDSLIKTETEADQSTNEDPTMTKVFYTIIDHMNLIQKLSICLYIVFILYLQWYIRYFMDFFGFFPGSPNTFENVMHLLNFINQIGLLFYLVFDLYQFFHWRKKLNKIQEFERSISVEFESA